MSIGPWVSNELSSSQNIILNLPSGIPFFDPANVNLDIATVGQQILGDNLEYLQVGNEPDLYVAHDHRPAGYDQNNYVTEFGEVVTAMQNTPGNAANMGLLVGPNIATDWTPEDVWNAGFLADYSANLATLAVER
jgi:hypothetical protein